jgi:2,3-bisphosphoglycerate-independent phosphoglycerate mutase
MEVIVRWVVVNCLLTSCPVWRGTLPSQAASTSAAIVNEFSDQVLELLKDHPVNISRKDRGLDPMNAILVRDAGSQLPNVKSIYEKYGISFGCIVDMPVEMGICKILGM